MRFDKTILLTAILALSATASAQTHAKQTFGIDPGQTPLLDTSLGYVFIHANAPPGQCGCFSANGGYGSAVINLPHGFSIVADLAAVHTNTVGTTTQSITVFNFLFGPRYRFRPVFRRYTPYAQVLGGGSQERSSYATVQNVQGAAFSIGGGVSTKINRRFGWTILEADWVQSRLPNAHNNLQNDLRISSGVSFRFGSR